MSGITFKPELNHRELVLLNRDSSQVGHDSFMTEKLLFCLLDTMKDMKAEIKQLRETNQRLESTLNSVLTESWGRKAVLTAK